MTVDVSLEDEQGQSLEVVGYPNDNRPNSLYPESEDPAFPLLAYLDPYGDTVFNRLQMEPFLTEWLRLYPKAQTTGEQEFLREVKRLALRCQNEVPLYLKFCGD